MRSQRIVAKIRGSTAMFDLCEMRAGRILLDKLSRQP
jgi:hypothetical protein